MATIYSSDRDGGGNDQSIEDVLLRNYHTVEVLKYPLDYGLELFIKCLEKEREDRLYMLWVAYFTNAFGGKERKSWEEFRGVSTKKSKPQGKIGTITGVDLAQQRK